MKKKSSLEIVNTKENFTGDEYNRKFKSNRFYELFKEIR
jgi:hypothetical protein